MENWQRLKKKGKQGKQKILLKATVQAYLKGQNRYLEKPSLRADKLVQTGSSSNYGSCKGDGVITGIGV